VGAANGAAEAADDRPMNDALKKTRILVIEDDTGFAWLLKKLLEEEGYLVEVAGSVAEGLPRAQSGDFDAVLSDLYLGGPSGLELVSQLRTANPHLPVILMTGQHSTEIAIEASKLGAYDYFPKPQATDFTAGPAAEKWPFLLAICEMIDKAVASKRLMETVKLPEDITPEDSSVGDRIIGNSRVMQNVYKEIGRVAAKPVTVLIRGETGTGKELVARAVFQHSDRADQPFIIVNCVAIPENLLESELFGHEAGAFTDAKTRRIGRFEQANHGTIFLDEIGDMSMGIQAKLLRVLQEKKIQRLGGKEVIDVDVRVIAATHRNLEHAIRQKEFRTDLYYRLNVAAIHLPALRERQEDIPEMVRYFLHRHGAELGNNQPTMTEDAIAHLAAQPWQGNVRELKNVMRKALLLARGYAISRELVTEALNQMTLPLPTAGQPFQAYVTDLLQRAKRGELENVQTALMQVAERELYGQAIRLAGGDQSRAARWLGVSRPTMREKLTRYGLYPSKLD
jgi:DNA-binding NtrC family response regulator